MLEIFPHLSDVKIEYAWGGTLAITVRRMPYLSRLEHNILSASGYSGHGVGTATHAGKMMALAISGDASGFDTMSKVPAMRFPGGPFAHAASYFGNELVCDAGPAWPLNKSFAVCFEMGLAA